MYDAAFPQMAANRANASASLVRAPVHSPSRSRCSSTTSAGALAMNESGLDSFFSILSISLG